MIIDFHTHAFPDNVAAKAIPVLEKEGNIKAHTAGTTQSLLSSMDLAGIDRSLICSIATRPEQFKPILNWSREVKNARLIPLPSIHPDDPHCLEHVYTVKQEGFIGIKMHPFYQDYFLNEKKLDPLYEALSNTGLLLVVHCGYDIAFPRIRRVDPAAIEKLQQRFPHLRLITTHFGGWDIWDEVEDILIGKNIYMEISFALHYLKKEQVIRMLNNHPQEYLLFGSDSPWIDQTESIHHLKALALNDKLLTGILGGNALRLIQEAV
ncbi:putative TIM-barrel fold metal-dependent hydrolase [Desulfocapsa sulfexigens DSM 10523]|uniref:Putative TIM-barrel fold metal-dependent hydrolase n=1 Tax=Desulfocapsa sulfexigens (strain DSM 10523 / SB164P1) TaxID=1167006 RepID=M1PCZ7_DESSD|nr:amidohydrolase family protein [Desulfocapsa sulfexigens]AGF77630.1 putative TIM-barrel fold metal-dependent hydrolase [Desulfocapsa sulfexigens DSM 10523]